METTCRCQHFYLRVFNASNASMCECRIDRMNCQPIFGYVFIRFPILGLQGKGLVFVFAIGPMESSVPKHLKFFNMKMSQRGAIRKAPSSMSWVFSLTNMSIGSKTFDWASVIRQWSHGLNCQFCFDSQIHS